MVISRQLDHVLVQEVVFGRQLTAAIISIVLCLVAVVWPLFELLQAWSLPAWTPVACLVALGIAWVLN